MFLEGSPKLPAMCSRYRVVKEKLTIRINGRDVEVQLRKRYNVAPRQKMPALLPNLVVEEMQWGWQPKWSKTLLINAQSETVLAKPTFKKCVTSADNKIGGRCLIPADGFYEWTATKQPIMFTKPNEEPFCFAGLWLETITTADTDTREKAFIILTTTPNETVAQFHTRMPLIVRASDYGWWLDPGERYQGVLATPDKGELQSVAVRRELNNVRNEGAELIQPAPIQKELF
jgi:putative SOS response-associated peptidase YedK